MSETIPAAIWPITVAQAAPAIPMRGQPSRPKIIIGSKIQFVIAPVSCEIIERTVRPVDCKSRSKVIEEKTPKDIIIQMFKYVTPYSIISGLEV